MWGDRESVSLGIRNSSGILVRSNSTGVWLLLLGGFSQEFMGGLGISTWR